MFGALNKIYENCRTQPVVTSSHISHRITSLTVVSCPQSLKPPRPDVHEQLKRSSTMTYLTLVLLLLLTFSLFLLACNPEFYAACGRLLADLDTFVLSIRNFDVMSCVEELVWISQPGHRSFSYEHNSLFLMTLDEDFNWQFFKK